MFLIPSIEAFLFYIRAFNIQKTSRERKSSIKFNRLGGVMGLILLPQGLLSLLQSGDKKLFYVQNSSKQVC